MNYVMVKGEQVDIEDVEFINIEEDMQGRDVITFGYNGEQHTSLVYRK